MISPNKFHLRCNSAACIAAAALTTVQTPYVLALPIIEGTKIPFHFAVYLANIFDHTKKHNSKNNVDISSGGERGIYPTIQCVSGFGGSIPLYTGEAEISESQRKKYLFSTFCGKITV